MAFSGSSRCGCDFDMGLLKVVKVQSVLQVSCQFIKTILDAVMCAHDMQGRDSHAEQSPVQEILFARDGVGECGFAPFAACRAMTGFEGNLAKRFQHMIDRMAVRTFELYDQFLIEFN